MGYHGELIFKFKPSLGVCGTGDYDPEEYEKRKDEWSLDDDDTVIAIPGKTPYLPDYVLGWDENVYDVGDKIGQIIILPYPKIEFDEVEELGESERGTGGFGSTGK